MHPDELQIRAQRAYRAFHSDASADGARVPLWTSLTEDQKRPWIAAVHAAVSYVPPNERQKSAQHVNALVKITQARDLLDEVVQGAR